MNCIYMLIYILDIQLLLHEKSLCVCACDGFKEVKAQATSVPQQLQFSVTLLLVFLMAHARDQWESNWAQYYEETCTWDRNQFPSFI